MSDETQINESSILEERKKKLKLLRDQNKAYINNFVRKRPTIKYSKTISFAFKR